MLHRTNYIEKDPLDFLSRLASLIPRPRIHLIRFPKAAFAPNCKYRSLVIPQPALLEKTSLKEKKSYSIGWAKMLKRVFDIDMQICSKCGGQVKIISAIHNQQAIKKILTHLGKNSKVFKLSPPRGPPETEENFITV